MKTYKVIIVGVVCILCGMLIGIQINKPTASEAAKERLRIFSDAYFGGYHDALYAAENNLLTSGVIKKQYFFRAIHVVNDDLPKEEVGKLWELFIADDMWSCE